MLQVDYVLFQDVTEVLLYCSIPISSPFTVLVEELLVDVFCCGGQKMQGRVFSCRLIKSMREDSRL